MNAPHLHDDSGAVAVIVAILMVVFLGMAALAIDAGDLWQTRRNLITATDAAALAGAQVAAATGGDRTAIEEACTDFLHRHNNPLDIALEDCDPQPTSSGGYYVTVDASTRVDFVFAPVLGLTNSVVTSTTTAKVDDEGIRPFGWCLVDDGYLEWYANGGGLLALSKHFAGGQCGDIAGNWGLLGLTDAANNPNTLADHLQTGMPTPPLCGSEDGPMTSGSTGAVFNAQQVKKAIEALDGQQFWVAVFNEHSQRQGNNAEFCIEKFLHVELDWSNTPPLSGAEIELYLTLLGETTNPSDLLGPPFICNVDPGLAASRCG